MEITEDKKKFWIVIKNTDQRYFKHFTKESAETEAKRLAKKEKGKFFVLESYLKVDDRIKSRKDKVKDIYKQLNRTDLREISEVIKELLESEG